MKLNLGCGRDVKEGYVNVDFFDTAGVDVKADLSKFPWPFASDSAEEILALDFVEHLPYRVTPDLLLELWRVLKPGGYVDIQVPDFEHCSLAAMDMLSYLCNVCGASSKTFCFDNFGTKSCPECGTSVFSISKAAIMRLYGGQDREGNWHFNAFPKEMMEKMLSDSGFGKFEYLEKHHQWLNWNYKIRAYKTGDVW